jgi:hypothetical protein
MTNGDDIIETEKPAANDNAYAFGRPLVRGLRRRPGVRYARSGNVILPLAFAERLPGWQEVPYQLRHRPDAAVPEASPAQPPAPPVR